MRSGRWPDADPDQPSLQAEELEVPAPDDDEPERPPQPGRVLTRLERTATDLADLMGQWKAVPVEKLTKAQAARVRSALKALQLQVAEMQARLGE